jgi:hypothetical protein
MKKEEIIEILKTAKKDFEAHLDNSYVGHDFGFCGHGFCWYFKDILGFKYSLRESILNELKKDLKTIEFDNKSWYKTIHFDGYSARNLKISYLEILTRRFFLYKIMLNNRILRKRIDHLEVTIARLSNELIAS